MTAQDNEMVAAAAAVAKRTTITDRIGWRGFLKFLISLAIVCLLGAVYFKNFGDATQLKYTVVFLIGGLLGLTEILGRYTDSPMAAIKSPGALIYVLVNAFGSVAALYLLTELAPDAVSNAVSRCCSLDWVPWLFCDPPCSKPKSARKRFRSVLPSFSTRC